jgi:hypothetical protein
VVAFPGEVCHPDTEHQNPSSSQSLLSKKHHAYVSCRFLIFAVRVFPDQPPATGSIARHLDGGVTHDFARPILGYPNHDKWV